MNFIVKKEILKYIKEKDMRVSGSLFQALNNKLERTLLKSIERAKMNNRTTIMDQDV